jgi:hypothetical protein
MANEVYRIRGSDITYRLKEVLLVMVFWSPQFFTDRAKHVLSRICDQHIVNNLPNCSDSSYIASYYDEAEESLSQLRMERRHNYISDGQRQFWQSAYSHALSMGGGKLDDVMLSFKKVTLLN